MSILSQIEKKNLAVEMVEAGFKNTVIEIATGLSNSMIRQVRVEQKHTNQKRRGGSLKIASRIVKNRRRMIDGGIIIQAYLVIAEEATRKIDFKALIAAHLFYLESHVAIYGRHYYVIDIDEAFVLVREYRSQSGAIQLNRCNCGCDFITVSEQRMSANCPICTLERKDNKGNDNQEDDILDSAISELISSESNMPFDDDLHYENNIIVAEQDVRIQIEA